MFNYQIIIYRMSLIFTNTILFYFIYFYSFISIFIFKFIILLMSKIDSNTTSSEKLEPKNNNKEGNPASSNKPENQTKREVVQQVPRNKPDTADWQKKKQRVENFMNKESGKKKRRSQSKDKFRRKKQKN